MATSAGRLRVGSARTKPFAGERWVHPAVGGDTHSGCARGGAELPAPGRNQNHRSLFSTQPELSRRPRQI
eukprot:3006983-Pyramimonas_sp.AAC.1